MPMNLKQMIKSKLFEVEQPQSEGEKNFKALHRAVNHKNLVPGITDQDHIFNGSTKPYDNKYNVGYKPGEDRAAYDKTLKLHDKETDNGYETAHVEEQIGSRIGPKGSHAAIRNVYEAKWMEKDLPVRNYNKDDYSEKRDIHHIEVHPKELKQLGIGHHFRGGEYGPTHHFEHPTHGKVAVYQSDLNKKSGNPIISVRTYGPPGAKSAAPKFASMLKGKTMHVYNESVNENYDDTPEEVSMVRTELKAIVADAQSLLDNMPSDMHIEPWVQSKIAVAKSMVCGVHDYMLYSDDDDKPSDMRSPMPSMSNPFSTNEENDLDEKLSPEQLKKFAKLAPPRDKITYADKIVAVKKKEAGQKILPEASMLGRECTACGEGHYKEINGKMCCDECGNVAKNEMKEALDIKSRALHGAIQAMHKLKPKNKHDIHVKMKTPKDTLNMNKEEVEQIDEATVPDSHKNEKKIASLQAKYQAHQNKLRLARETRKMRGQRQQGSAELRISRTMDDISDQIHALQHPAPTNEEVEQFDEILKASDSVGKWIDDFTHSKDPKFNGKSKEERRKMALGAYYGAQKESYENSTEELAEGRGRPPKKGSKAYLLAKEKEAKGENPDLVSDRNIINQFRKKPHVNDNGKLVHHITFADKEKHEIPKEHVDKAMNLWHSAIKPAQKLEIQRGLEHSKDSFHHTIKHGKPPEKIIPPKVSLGKMKAEAVDRKTASSDKKSMVAVTRMGPKGELSVFNRSQGPTTRDVADAKGPTTAQESYDLSDEVTNSLNNLYNSLSEQNKELFEERIMTEEGVFDLINFARKQGF